MPGRGKHPARRAVRRRLRCAGVVWRFHQLAPGFTVQLPEPRALGRITDDDEAPALAVAAAGRADGRIQNLPDDGVRDRIGLQTTHRPLRGHGLEEFHTLVESAQRRAGLAHAPPSSPWYVFARA